MVIGPILRFFAEGNGISETDFDIVTTHMSCDVHSAIEFQFSQEKCLWVRWIDQVPYPPPPPPFLWVVIPWPQRSSNSKSSGNHALHTLLCPHSPFELQTHTRC